MIKLFIHLVGHVSPLQHGSLDIPNRCNRDFEIPNGADKNYPENSLNDISRALEFAQHPSQQQMLDNLANQVVASCAHHLTPEQKASLIAKIRMFTQSGKYLRKTLSESNLLEVSVIIYLFLLFCKPILFTKMCLKLCDPPSPPCHHHRHHHQQQHCNIVSNHCCCCHATD